jgi:hypothetical protein
LYDAVKLAEDDWERVQSENPATFTSIPIDPIIMAEEREFQLRQRPLFQVLVDSDSEDERGIREEEEGRETGHNMFTVSLVRSVVSLDFIAAGADFIEFE